MAGSSIGTLFRVTTWGESHGAGIGAVVDGCPAGLRERSRIVLRFSLVFLRLRPREHQFP